MSVKASGESVLSPEVRSWCKKHYPRLLANVRACLKLYRAFNKPKPRTVKIIDLAEGERAIIRGWIVDKRVYKYEGCPDTMRKEPCPDGSIATINVYRFEIADETDSVWATVIVPEYTDEDEYYAKFDVGMTVEASGVVKKRVTRDGDERLELALWRRGGLRPIQEPVDPEQEKHAEETAIHGPPAAGEQEQVQEEPAGEEPGSDALAQLKEYVATVKSVPLGVFRAIARNMGLDPEKALEHFRVEDGKVKPK